MSYGKKGQRLLENFWKIWKDEYLLSLRERSQRNMKSLRIKSNAIPKVEAIVQIKEGLKRGSWKMGKIIELIKSNDGIIRAAKIALPTKNVINRPLNLLYPLECEEDQLPETSKLNCQQTDNIEDREKKDDVKERKPTRKAAQEARDKILGHSLLDEL